jgi:hypothetical protein
MTARVCVASIAARPLADLHRRRGVTARPSVTAAAARPPADSIGEATS